MVSYSYLVECVAVGCGIVIWREKKIFFGGRATRGRDFGGERKDMAGKLEF